VHPSSFFSGNDPAVDLEFGVFDVDFLVSLKLDYNEIESLEQKIWRYSYLSVHGADGLILERDNIN
jgi:hypothetical protein